MRVHGLCGGTSHCISGFLRMRIREENCNMVLMAGVTLLSAAVAGAAALLEPASVTNKSKPAYVADASIAAPSNEQQPRLVDQTQVRVIGAPFVPNTNPRQR
jgi:hypothetical protein